MMNKSFCFLNGTFLNEEEAAIPINDRGFLFGDGLFTTIRVIDGVIEFLDEHLHRLRKQCEALNIVPPTINRDILEKLIDQNHAHQGTWRLKIIITGGITPHLNLSQRNHGSLLITLKPFTVNSSCRLTLYPEPIHRPVSTLKTLSYLDRLWVKEYAQQKGYDDAIVRSPEGYLLETAFSNIYWIEGDHLFTPSKELPLMQGIMLENILKNAPSVHQVKVKKIPPTAELYSCNCMTGPIKSTCSQGSRPVLQTSRHNPYTT